MPKTITRSRRRSAGVALLAAALTALAPGGTASGQSVAVDSSPEAVRDRAHLPSPIPDRVVLTWSGDVATTQSVTWRTDASVDTTVAQITLASANPTHLDSARTVSATTSPLNAGGGLAHFHSVTFTDLRPDTLYAYRVRGGGAWSEWFHFRTARREAASYSFIYFGDAQNDIKSLWSRAIRAAYTDAPDARLMVHAGDLVNRAANDWEWGEWFQAGGWLNGMLPSIVAPGNHELITDPTRAVGNRQRLSPHWRAQFTLPDDAPAGLEETVYHVDYQGTRFIVLNSTVMSRVEEQARWLEPLLANNPNRWTVIVYHHPMFSVARGRDNPALREHWKPLFDRYRVDLVLQGHDHIYGRGVNIPEGATVSDLNSGTMYVVSVSGPKMYQIDSSARWMDALVENTQLYQIVHVGADTLRFEARTVTGALHDSFMLVKRPGQSNLVVEATSRMPARIEEQ